MLRSGRDELGGVALLQENEDVRNSGRNSWGRREIYVSLNQLISAANK